jgi:hypothetical protein
MAATRFQTNGHTEASSKPAAPQAASVAANVIEARYILAQVEHAKRRQYTGQGCMGELLLIADAAERIADSLGQ